MTEDHTTEKARLMQDYLLLSDDLRSSEKLKIRHTDPEENPTKIIKRAREMGMAVV